LKLGLIIYSDDPETVWNAFRIANFALQEGDTVRVYLIGRGVECETLDTNTYNVTKQIQAFAEGGGSILACGTCLKIRQSEGLAICPLSPMQDCYDIIKESDKVLTF
jgi:uncharacterized protein involved in oxidation of intracellular sulfur